MSNQIIIYGLVDPREPDHIRYIGKTKTGSLADPRSRHKNCLSQKKSQWNRKHTWIKSLFDIGLMFDIKVIGYASQEYRG